MKSYTDIPQSKKLAEILPINSADMYYSNEENITLCSWNDDEHDYDDIPAWSLAALLDFIPVILEYNDTSIRLRIDKGNNISDKYAMWYEELSSHLSTNIESEASEFVDACYEMLIKLHEQKLL